MMRECSGVRAFSIAAAHQCAFPLFPNAPAPRRSALVASSMWPTDSPAHGLGAVRRDAKNTLFSSISDEWRGTHRTPRVSDRRALDAPSHSRIRSAAKKNAQSC